MKIYGVFDGAAKYFLPIFTARNDAHAKRMFMESIGAKFVHRSDYTLMCLAEFNEESGEITQDQTHIVMQGAAIPPEYDPNAQGKLPFPAQGENFKTLGQEEPEQ